MVRFIQKPTGVWVLEDEDLKGNRRRLSTGVTTTRRRSPPPEVKAMVREVLFPLWAAEVVEHRLNQALAAARANRRAMMAEERAVLAERRHARREVELAIWLETDALDRRRPVPKATVKEPRVPLTPEQVKARAALRRARRRAEYHQAKKAQGIDSKRRWPEWAPTPR